MATGEPEDGHVSPAPVVADPAGGGAPPGLRAARHAWLRLLRMSTALWLLAALATAATIATFVPQEPVTPRTVEAWRDGVEGPGPMLTAVVEATGAFDVFGTWWFDVLLVLLVVSLTGCVVRRVTALGRTARRPPTVGEPPSSAVVARWQTTATADDALDGAARVLEGRRFRVARGDGVVVAERGRVAREAGSLLFHASLYPLLAGAVVGHTLGFTGQVDLAEGQGFAETRLAYDLAEPARWFSPDDHAGYVLTLDDFELAAHPDGTAADYVATVTVADAPAGDGATRTERVRINEPLRHAGTRVNLLRFGVAPAVVVRDRDGATVFRGPVLLGGTGAGSWVGGARISLGDLDGDDQAAVTVTVVPTTGEDDGAVAVDPRGGASGSLPADPLVVVDLYAGDLGLERPLPLSDVAVGWRATQLVGRASLREGDAATLGPDHTVELVAVASWAGFQVSHAPGRGLLVVGAASMLVGLAASLYGHRRRVWVGVDGTEVVVAGRAWHRHDVAAEELTSVVADVFAVTAGRAARPATVAGGRDRP